MNRRSFLTRTLAAGLAAATSRVRAGQSGYTLTFLGSLSGSGAAFAKDALDGLSLGLKDLGYRLANQEVRVVVEDDKGKPGAALEAARRLVMGETSDVVVTALWPSALIQAAPVFEQARTFVVNVGQAPQILSDSGCNPWFFDLAGEEDGVHEAAGAAMTADQVRRVVVVGQDRPATAEAAAALGRTFQGEIIDVVRQDEGAATFGPTLSAIAHQFGGNAGAVYMLLTGGQGVAFMRGWPGMGGPGAGGLGKVKLYAPWRGFERSYLAAMGDGAIGATVIGTWNTDFDQPPNHRLITEYEAEYGRAPSTWSAHGYDVVSLLDAAVHQVQGKFGDADMVRGALRRVDFPSTRGPLKFNLNQFPVMSYWRFVVSRDAKGRLFRELKGPVVKDWRGHGGQCPMRWDDQPMPQPGAKKKS